MRPAGAKAAGRRLKEHHVLPSTTHVGLFSSIFHGNGIEAGAYSSFERGASKKRLLDKLMCNR